ncbi:MAG TPA: protein kinase, partial [Kofleriaceae bacterium]|nr:protein kinase [Kofleriaceae bacterium]
MIGQTIAGRYRLVEQIGEGATGTVYRAEVEGGGEAAVKVLRAEPGARERERRFEREAVAGSHAEHPNCVAVRDFGALEDGRPYLVMELVRGRSLAELLAGDKQLEPTRALRILAHVLRGLD